MRKNSKRNRSRLYNKKSLRKNKYRGGVNFANEIESKYSGYYDAESAPPAEPAAEAPTRKKRTTAPAPRQTRTTAPTVATTAVAAVASPQVSTAPAPTAAAAEYTDKEPQLKVKEGISDTYHEFWSGNLNKKEKAAKVLGVVGSPVLAPLAKASYGVKRAAIGVKDIAKSSINEYKKRFQYRINARIKDEDEGDKVIFQVCDYINRKVKYYFELETANLDKLYDSDSGVGDHLFM